MRGRTAYGENSIKRTCPIKVGHDAILDLIRGLEVITGHWECI